MAEGLQTTDGTVLDVAPADDDAKAFAAAMAAPESTDAEVPAPPKREAAADAEAPYGRKADGSPKKGPGGRPPKPSRTERPRVETTAVASGQPGRDYTEDLTGLAQGVWFLLASLPPTQAQAALFKAHRGGLVNGWNVAAQANPMIRGGVEWLTGSGTWVAAVAMATVPFVMQSIALWTGQLPAETTKSLAAATVHDLDEIRKAQEAAFAAAAGAPMAA